MKEKQEKMIRTGDRNIDADLLHTKLLYLGLVMNVFIPVLFLFLGIFLRSQGLNGHLQNGLNMLFGVLMALSLCEIPILYLVRKKTLSARTAYRQSHPQADADQLLFQWAAVIFCLAFSPTVYGLVYFFLGGMPERFVLLVAVTLVCFMLFKPKSDEIRTFVENNHIPVEDVKGF